MSSSESSGRGLAYGVFLVICGCFLAWQAWLIEPSGMTNPRDIGPKAFPLALGAALAAAGVWFCLMSVRADMSRSPDGAVEPTSPVKPDVLSPVARALRPALVIVGLVVLTLAMPIVGFSIATFVFATLMLLLMGDRSPLSCVITAVALVAIVQLLFVRVFQVVLPTGPLGL
ncbi:MAG: tripartite tricarboxylate transporter TctB family protein [Planctomycetales bacterium]|nr:tripartite tricarboxylate transporter TctB family protein [Planctomycetales bacterium]